MSDSGISWAICKSAPRSRQTITLTPHHSFFTGRMPFLPPNQQRQSTEGTCYVSCCEWMRLLSSYTAVAYPLPRLISTSITGLAGSLLFSSWSRDIWLHRDFSSVSSASAGGLNSVDVSCSAVANLCRMSLISSIRCSADTRTHSK